MGAEEGGGRWRELDWDRKKLVGNLGPIIDACGRTGGAVPLFCIEVVGASPSGQASVSRGRARTTSAAAPSALSCLEVNAMSGTEKRRV